MKRSKAKQREWIEKFARFKIHFSRLLLLWCLDKKRKCVSTLQLAESWKENEKTVVNAVNIDKVPSLRLQLRRITIEQLIDSDEVSKQGPKP